MDSKRKSNSSVLCDEKRPRTLSNNLSPSSPATSDLFEPELDTSETENTKEGENIASPSTSDFFDQFSERNHVSPLQTSELFEPQEFDLSENEDDRPLEALNQDIEDSDEDIGCAPLEASDHEEGTSPRDIDFFKEPSFDFNQLNGALVFVHFPATSPGHLRQIINVLTESGADVSDFFHGKITHLITSKGCLEKERDEILTSKKLLTDPSSRSAKILARSNKRREKANIVEKAKNLGIKVVFLEEMNLVFTRKEKPPGDMLISDSTLCKFKHSVQDVPSVKVRKLRPPFIKVVDHSESFRPLVLEMKEWPDALTMFSQGPNVLDTKVERDRRVTYCELCETRFNDLQTHLSSSEHVKNATDSKKWERVDALRSKLPTVKQMIESKLEQLKKMSNDVPN